LNSGDLTLDFRKHALQRYGKFVAGERAPTLESPIRIAGENALLSQALNGVVCPVCGRHVRKGTASLSLGGTRKQGANPKGGACPKCPLLAHRFSSIKCEK
jgi:hypothetical protein